MSQDTAGVVHRAIRKWQSGPALPNRSPFEPISPRAEPRSPQALPLGQQLEIQSAQSVKREGDDVYLEGEVRFRYRGYDCRADRAQGNLRDKVFFLEGDVIIDGEEETISGQAIQMNFERRTYRFLYSQSTIRPGMGRGQLQDDLYVSGISGSGDRSQLLCEICKATTCDADRPHFELEAKTADIKPGKRAILYNAAVRVLNKTILRLPFLVIPLNELNDKYTPEVGRSPDEGYYIKNRIGMPLPGDSALFYRLDYFEKLGPAFGGDYYYETDKMLGRASIYAFPQGPRSVTGSMDHQMKLGASRFRFYGNLQQNNYLTAPTTISSSGTSTLTIPQGGQNSSQLQYSRSFSQSGTFRSVNDSYGFVDRRVLGGVRLQSDVRLARTESTSGTGTDIRREVVALVGSAARQFNFGEAVLEFSRTIPVGEVANFFPTADKTPLFTFRSDSARLFGREFGRRQPFQFEWTSGEWLDTITRNPITRHTFEVRLPQRQLGSRRTSLSYSARFRQGFYDDDTAQYLLDFRPEFRHRLGDDTALTIGYSYLRPYGFSPLQIDRSGETNRVDAGVSYRPIRSLRLSATTAYDMLQLKERRVAWQFLNLDSVWEPHRDFRLRTSAGYDSFRSVWSNVRFDLQWWTGRTFVTAGARYDASRHTWANVNLLVQGLQLGKLTANVLFNYNGFTKKFESQQYLLVYDLHCAEAILTYKDSAVGFRSGREVSFFIRLKALPTNTNFGIGRRGQGIGTGTGIN